MLMVRWLGGAFVKVDPQATAVAFRSAEAFVVTAAFVPPGSPASEVARVKAALAPYEVHALGGTGTSPTRWRPASQNGCTRRRFSLGFAHSSAMGIRTTSSPATTASPRSAPDESQGPVP